MPVAELEAGFPILIRVASKGVCADAWRIVQMTKKGKLAVD